MLSLLLAVASRLGAREASAQAPSRQAEGRNARLNGRPDIRARQDAAAAEDELLQRADVARPVAVGRQGGGDIGEAGAGVGEEEQRGEEDEDTQ
eukprot:CAMPEP_0196694356 /NCGR_PEP_ID=MMETSP1090-20130531/33491_1 /TAXON_ID=37098 /ORGANISM="Isochrysis sp, Strain CCMP1244" /LENGTH=93 /DNA_ID=CAMNT_0042033841 /DNA_START=200 /DNA_END=478 /DNA_ORIENTATION=+